MHPLFTIGVVVWGLMSGYTLLTNPDKTDAFIADIYPILEQAMKIPPIKWIVDLTGLRHPPCRAYVLCRIGSSSLAALIPEIITNRAPQSYLDGCNGKECLSPPELSCPF